MQKIARTLLGGSLLLFMKILTDKYFLLSSYKLWSVYFRLFGVVSLVS